MKKWILLAVLAVISIFIYNYIYQNHRNINNENAEYNLNSVDILNKFSIDPVNSEKKYLNKTIEVIGTITNQTKNTMTLDHVVFCQFTTNINIQLKDNSQIKIKGRFIGYDDLLEEIKLDQCNIIN
ncbi:MAG: OB-fold putative lipoprotein [Flavobacteriaceae bacterium]|nr:OB-fold putative lipoprotein [Flavobacteriaceae bacterium]